MKRLCRAFSATSDYEKAADAVGKTIELLAPKSAERGSEEKTGGSEEAEEEERPNFLVFPLDDPGV